MTIHHESMVLVLLFVPWFEYQGPADLTQLLMPTVTCMAIRDKFQSVISRNHLREAFCGDCHFLVIGRTDRMIYMMMMITEA
jgi:hypothetical protein